MRFHTKGPFKLSPTLLCLIKPAFPLDRVDISAFILQLMKYVFVSKFSESHTLQIINKKQYILQYQFDILL